MVDEAYLGEINFLKYRCARLISWTGKPIIERIISELLTLPKAQEILEDLKKSFKEKCMKKGKAPESILSLHTSQRGVRIIVKVPALREVFGDEIDDADMSGGGGRKLRQSPLLTRLARR